MSVCVYVCVCAHARVCVCVYVWFSVGIHSPRDDSTSMLLTIDPLTKCKGVNADPSGNVFDTRQRAGVRLGNWKLLTGDAGK